MGYLQETPSWDEGVPYFAADAILTGGPDCPDNIPIQALTNRTAYLKGLVEEVGAGSVRLVGDQRIEGRKDFADSPLVPNVPAGATGKQAVNAAFVNDALSKAAGLPLLFPLWCPNRTAIPAGYAPAAGQPLARSLYPDAWAGIAAGNVPVATDAAWLATPTERGKFTAGNGSTTFRLPDYNGKSAGSLGALFMRGDGTLSAQTDGVIQPDDFRSHFHIYGNYSSTTATLAVGPTSNPGTFASSSSGSTGGAETRPMNVTGCWVIRLFGAVVNPGAADAAQLATEVSKLGADKVPFAAFQGANQSLASNGYQKLPGGLILQWGTYTYSAGTDSVVFSVTFPLAFPGACFVVTGNASGTSDFFSDVSKTTTGFSGRIFDRIGSAPVGPGSLYWYAIGN